MVLFEISTPDEPRFGKSDIETPLTEQYEEYISYIDAIVGDIPHVDPDCAFSLYAHTEKHKPTTGRLKILARVARKSYPLRSLTERFDMTSLGYFELTSYLEYTGQFIVHVTNNTKHECLFNTVAWYRDHAVEVKDEEFTYGVPSEIPTMKLSPKLMDAIMGKLTSETTSDTPGWVARVRGRPAGSASRYSYFFDAPKQRERNRLENRVGSAEAKPMVYLLDSSHEITDYDAVNKAHSAVIEEVASVRNLPTTSVSETAVGRRIIIVELPLDPVEGIFTALRLSRIGDTIAVEMPHVNTGALVAMVHLVASISTCGLAHVFADDRVFLVAKNLRTGLRRIIELGYPPNNKTAFLEYAYTLSEPFADTTDELIQIWETIYVYRLDFWTDFERVYREAYTAITPETMELYFERVRERVYTYDWRQWAKLVGFPQNWQKLPLLSRCDVETLQPPPKQTGKTRKTKSARGGSESVVSQPVVLESDDIQKSDDIQESDYIQESDDDLEYESDFEPWV